MGWIDLAGVGLLGVFVGVGAMRGFVAGILGVIALLAAYALSYFAAQPLSGPLAASLGVEPLIAWLLAGTAVFALSWLVFALASAIWLRRRRRRKQGIAPADRIGGALLGGAQGALVAVLLYWVVGQAQASGLFGPPSEPSALVHASQQVVQSGARAVLGGDGGNPLAARVVADPVGTATQLQKVLETPAMTELQGDQLFWQYVSSGAIDAALNQASFMRAANDAQLRQRIVDLGVMPEAARDDPKAFRNATRDALREVAPRLQAIREDPALDELAADPMVRQALEAGDFLSLAANPKIRELVSRALAAEPPASPAPAD
jgi:uncharacterized membrane protein required for colicin V production